MSDRSQADLEVPIAFAFALAIEQQLEGPCELGQQCSVERGEIWAPGRCATKKCPRLARPLE